MTEGTEWQAIAVELMAAGVSTVYEAAGRRGGMEPGLRPIVDGLRLFSRARTAHCQPGDNLAVHRVVAEAQPGDVLVVDGAGVLVGYWGEILTASAQVRGVAGLVIDGGVRDIAAIRVRRFPVWARGISMLSAAKVSPGEVGRPIVCGGIALTTGDWVLADDDGVLAIGAENLRATLEGVRARIAYEAAIMERIGQGTTTIEALNLSPVLRQHGIVTGSGADRDGN